ncbi:MAG: AbrB/MazE/SpoVT family DNA-binding domain-containing protein [Clostridia bacterium]|nr:AbrB/MazE/SpoVT family DNA-binding domain-containing protein [Clostridia bacterium]MBQ4637618.1 AbrB/MazE/SpoVT family DNA-binding domain-containing protein [Clostridia bacterium]
MGTNGKYAWTAKVGEKGQIVIPKEAREIFDINPGDTVIILGDIERGLAITPGGFFDKMHELIMGSNPNKEEK